MGDRRQDLLDAGITVLGTSGARGFTHRAVDAAAGVPVGSTSNHFPTRDGLLEAVAERFSLRERANWDDIAATVCPTTAGELALVLAAWSRDAAGPNRTLTLARYALLVEAAQRPSLQPSVAATGRRVSAWAANWLRVVGSADPDRDVHVVGNYVTGLVLHQLAVPDPAFDPTEPLLLLLTALLPAAPGRRPRPAPYDEPTDPAGGLARTR